MSEVREDFTTGGATIYTPERSHRPRELPISSDDRSSEVEYSPTCPFCPGNEALLARIILEAEDETGLHGRRVLSPTDILARPEGRTLLWPPRIRRA